MINKIYDEWVIAELFRSLHRLDIIESNQQIEDLVDELQIRLFASERGVTVDELFKELGISRSDTISEKKT